MYAKFLVTVYPILVIIPALYSTMSFRPSVTTSVGFQYYNKESVFMCHSHSLVQYDFKKFQPVF